MSDILRGNFDLPPVKADDSAQSRREEFRKRALESIAGSMVFVEDALLYWDIRDE